jgi:hypothetical protein
MHIRRTSLLLGLVLVLSLAIPLQAQNGDEVLTNDSVITLSKAGLSSTIIVNKIRASKTNFNMSTDELIRLKQARISDEIVAAMFDATHRRSENTSTIGAGDVSNGNPNDPNAAHEAGIYLLLKVDGKQKMVQLEPSVSKQQKTGGVFQSALTYGIAKVKFKAALNGKTAALQINEPRPVFYFYFEVKGAGLSTSSYYATNPNEFSLVKLDAKSNTREVTVSQANAFGAQSGTMDKAARAFTYEKIAPGVYKVTPQQDLTDGEYGFYNAAGVGPTGGAKIFDFGIKLPG